MSYHDIPRAKFPWFPSINYEVCTKDLDCLNFCPCEVYEWDPETGRPVVVYPDRCLPGCDACAERCKAGAIAFPSKDEFRAAMRQWRAEMGAGTFR